MDFRVAVANLATQRTGCVVAGVHEGGVLSPSARALDTASGGALARVLARGDLTGEPGTTLLLHDVPQIAAERVLLVGMGREGVLRESAYRKAVAAAARVLRDMAAQDLVFCLHEAAVADRGPAWKMEQAVLGVMENLYRFERLKRRTPGRASALQRVYFHLGEHGDRAGAEAALARGQAIGEGVSLARDLGNLPGNVATPSHLAEQARELGRRHGFEVQVHGPQQIEQLGMGGLLAVARGSRQPAQFIVMMYAGGARDARPVVLVGKGITFDTGGICIKPATELDEMKFDMCGAASVFGALHAAARMRLALNVVGIVPAAENMPGGNATKPGDVVTTMSGQTVEILDTDSEGRLVLCDALTYAERLRPAVVVDIATLTAEIVHALGDVASGLFTGDDALARELLAAGDGAWDRAWRMPLWDDYQEVLASNFADLPNIGSRSDSAPVAACFLSRFTHAYPWAHLDIAGTASVSGPDKGATGRPVALLAHFLAARAGTPGSFPREG